MLAVVGGIQADMMLMSARLGSSLLSFVDSYQMISCTSTDILLGAPGYTLDMPNADPVRRLTITADAGVGWDQLIQHRICESYFPTNAVFERQMDNHYYFSTDAGEIVFTPLPNTCILAFTEA